MRIAEALMSGFKLRRLAMLMEPEPGNPQEIEGVLNPAAARCSFIVWGINGEGLQELIGQ